MNRRNFIAGLGSTAAWPVVGRAQQRERARHIGVIIGADENDPVWKTRLSAFTQALANLGWTDGGNARIDFRWYGDNVDLIRARALELVSLQPNIIVANSTPATVVLKRETRTIPIVFVGVTDPVASGIVARLDRPNGNATGFALYEPALGAKWLELLSEIAPGIKRAAIMFNPDTAPASLYMPGLETAARSLKFVAISAPVRSDGEIATALIELGRDPGGGLVVPPDSWMNVHRSSTISAAARNSIPAVYFQSDFVRYGGLLSYGVDQVENWRRAASYVDSILRGAKTVDLPVQFPVKYEMVLNLKTAKALGLAVPQSILLRADEVIE
jgi:putative tryptophan/tyrosine transport system substrate-binding protein